jgi:hypothetical protein
MDFINSRLGKPSPWWLVREGKACVHDQRPLSGAGVVPPSSRWAAGRTSHPHLKLKKEKKKKKKQFAKKKKKKEKKKELFHVNVPP